jgi:RND superfamily putative drug exporter
VNNVTLAPETAAQAVLKGETGLGAGILLDATVVRALLVPALVSVFGSWNWWMPRWFARLLLLPAPKTSLIERPS